RPAIWSIASHGLQPSIRMTSAPSSNGSGKTIRPSIRSNHGWTRKGGSPAPTAREAPNSKHQAPEKHQTTNNKPQRTFVANLELEIWNFFGAWNLELISFSPAQKPPAQVSRLCARHPSVPARRSRI